MLLLKSKKEIELLPPPPPFPTFEIEDNSSHPKELTSKSIQKQRRPKRIDDEIIEKLENDSSDIKLDFNEHSVDFPDRLEGSIDKSRHLDDARQEISEIAQKARVYDKKSFFSGLFENKESSHDTTTNEGRLGRIQSQIKNGLNALRINELESAKKIYLDIMKMYNSISDAEKRQIYGQINEFYYKRKKAEGHR